VGREGKGKGRGKERGRTPHCFFDKIEPCVHGQPA